MQPAVNIDDNLQSQHIQVFVLKILKLLPGEKQIAKSKLEMIVGKLLPRRGLEAETGGVFAYVALHVVRDPMGEVGMDFDGDIHSSSSFRYMLPIKGDKIPPYDDFFCMFNLAQNAPS